MTVTRVRNEINHNGAQCISPPRPPISLNSLSVLTAIFPGEPESAGFIEAKDDGGGEW